MTQEPSTLDHTYWHKRWQDGETGWHQTDVSPSLRAHWPVLGLAGKERVLVPFCGKSLDMRWLAEQGHEVLGVEFSRLPIEQFFAEQQWQPTITQQKDGLHYRAGRIEIIEADLFQVDRATLAGCQAVYDRGALIAQPQEQRARYLDHIYAALPTGCRGLLLTVDYMQSEMAGPPFAVTAAELETHLAEWQVERLQREDILAASPRFVQQGVSHLHADAWLLTKLGSL